MGKRIGNYLQELRAEQGWSIRQLGAEVGISASHLSLVEKGRREVSITALLPIVKALNGNFVDALRLLAMDAGIPTEVINEPPSDRTATEES